MSDRIKVKEVHTNVKGGTQWTKRVAVKDGKKELFAVQYWPDSRRSSEEMEKILAGWYRSHPKYEAPNI